MPHIRTEQFPNGPLRRDRTRLQRAVISGPVLLACCLSAVRASSAEVAPDGPPPFEQVCFGDFDDEKGFPIKDHLKQVLEPVPGHQANVGDSKYGNRPILHLSGLFRLKLPWPPDSALRLAWAEQKDLRLHFWSGRTGVTLRFYPSNNGVWAAYGTTRSDNRPKPETRALWAMDNGRNARSRAGTVEVRHQDGRLVLSRGDLVLLCVPLSNRPNEIYFQVDGKLRGLGVVRSKPARLDAVSPPAASRTLRPADLDWRIQKEKPEAKLRLDKLPDGRVELVAEADVKRGRATAVICRPGLYEYIFQVEHADPKTGIFVADDRGEPQGLVGFMRHQQTGRAMLGLTTSIWDNFERSVPENNVIALAGPNQWLRMVAGAGTCRAWTSGDGVRWSEFDMISVGIRGARTCIGLCCGGEGGGNRKITLRSVTVRPLDRLTALAPASVIRRVGTMAAAKNSEDWEQRVLESRPADIEPATWRQACMVYALGENVEAAVAQRILHELIDAALSENGDWRLKLRLLDQACLLGQFSYGSDYANVPKFASHYRQLGQTLIGSDHPAPFTVISGALLRMPAWTPNTPMFPQDLLRHELLTAVYQRRWQDVGQLCRRLKYWARMQESVAVGLPWASGHEVTTHLIRWADAQALLHSAAPPGGKRPAITARLKHPLIERLSKESYNVQAEFNAALDGRAYRAACQIVVNSKIADETGLLPIREDGQMLVSLPMAVELAMQRIPELHRTMKERYGPLGRLRLEQAVADGDAAAARAVTFQFLGTEAAADAHGWLGDRLLSQGQFGQAFGQYRQAMRHARADRHAGLLVRLRLAAAMMGRDVGQPAGAPVTIGRTRLSAKAFEEIVRRARESRRGPETAGPPDDAVAALGRCPPPGSYEIRAWASTKGDANRRLGGLPMEGFDWPARQTAVGVGNGQMIVNDPVDLVGFDLGSGRELWKRQSNLSRREPAWFVAAFCPVIDRGRLFVRQVADHGPELTCLDAVKGEPLWNMNSTGVAVSDPLLIGEKLLTFVAVKDLGGELTLELAALDPKTGRVQHRRPVAKFHDHWAGAVPCRAIQADHEIVAAVGGTVLCCNPLGQVRWLRRQTWVPRPEHAHLAHVWLRRVHDAPLMLDGRIYATQPGVWAIECIDLDSGRIVWRTALPELISLAGNVERRLIAETTQGLLALDADTGKVLWRHAVEDRLDTRVCTNPEAVCYIRLEQRSLSDQDQPRRPVLVWIDPPTGRVTAESVLEVAAQKGPLVGPLVANGTRCWALVGSRDKPADREIRELVLAKP